MQNETLRIEEPSEADRPRTLKPGNDMGTLSKLFVVDNKALSEHDGAMVPSGFEFSTLLSTSTSTNNEGVLCLICDAFVPDAYINGRPECL